MSAQVEFLQNATRYNAYSPLIATVSAADLVRHEDRIAELNPIDIPISEVSVRHPKQSWIFRKFNSCAMKSIWNCIAQSILYLPHTKKKR